MALRGKGEWQEDGRVLTVIRTIDRPGSRYR